MKLIINSFFFIIFLNSCTIDYNKKELNYLNINKENIIENIENTNKENVVKNNENKNIVKVVTNKEIKKLKNNIPIYIVGDSYFIEGVEHTPQENYNYNETGLATYYGKDLHNKRTLNNELNKVTELLGRHKSLPLPSVVKITNLENGLSLIIRVNDRNNKNASIIEVSRKVAQLLRFYKSGIARVRVEIVSDSSKQLKIVTKTMSDPEFNITLNSSPTETVFISDLNETIKDSETFNNNFEQPIELGFEQVSESILFVEIYDFDSYNDIRNIISSFEINYKTTIQNEGNSYTAIFGPLNNIEANKLVQFLISKGYKNAKIVIQ